MGGAVMKRITRRSLLTLLCVLALTIGLLPAAAFAWDYDTIYVNGDKKMFTAEGDLSAILRLPVEVPGRIHILTSGVNIALSIYNEASLELCGTYYTENGLIDVPFDAYPGSYLLGFSGWGEVAVLVADESLTARFYANAQPAEEPPAEAFAQEPSEEVPDEATEPALETTEMVPVAAAEEPDAVPAEISAESAGEDFSEASVNELTEMAAEVSAVEAEEAVTEDEAETAVDRPLEAPNSETALPQEKAPAEVPSVELSEVFAQEVTEEPEEVPAEEPAPKAAGEPEEEPGCYDPAIPIYYEFTGGDTVSVLSILNGVGAPVNMVMEVNKDTDGWFFATGSSDGDWRLTPFAYFDSMDVSVRAAYYNGADGSVTDAVYTLNLSYPDPAPAVEAPVENSAQITEVTIAVERREGNEIRLFAENVEEADSEKYLYQWQYSVDSLEWLDVAGANGSDYIFQLDSANGGYYWRLVVSEK